MSRLLMVLLCGALLTAEGQTPGKLEFPSAKFMTGDKSTWASPFFNDESWPSIKTDEPWEGQGYNGYNGFAWYRLHFSLPSSLRDGAFWKDSLRIFLARIDDADEVYLNGSLIAKHGSFPDDEKGYIAKWNSIREIHLASTNPLLAWDRENLLAIRVYDGGGAGGIFSAVPFVNMMDIIDGIRLSLEFDPFRENRPVLFTRNVFSIPIEGELSVKLTDTEKDSVYYAADSPLSVPSTWSFSTDLDISPQKRTEVLVVFKEKNTGRTVSIREISRYILTPAPSLRPRINGPSVVGVRPKSPFLFKVPATGRKPLKYSAENLPAGLVLEPSTGIIRGSLSIAGQYRVRIMVRNDMGSASKELLIRCSPLLALTPPMGWNSWNCWGLSVSDQKLRASAQALIDKGLADHGWTYMNIDDGWEAPKRNADGTISPNEKFPDMKGLGDWLHSKGLKFGIYSSPGPLTCGGYLGSWSHEEQDAGSYNSWGIDYLKYDWCSYEEIHGKDTSLASYKKPYEVMQKALRRQPRDILYSLCQYGMKNVWEWGKNVDGNCWRTTGDIEDSWQSLKSIGFNQDRMSPFARPGRWNDPDMLVVGLVGWGEDLHPTRLTPDEQYTHISLWCLLSAPLLIGCDISRLDDFTLNLFSNDEVIRIDQDPLGRQARRIINKPEYQLWVKDLDDGTKAVGLFNLSDEFRLLSLPRELLRIRGKMRIRDCWRQKDLGVFENFETRVAPHGVTLINVSALPSGK